MVVGTVLWLHRLLLYMCSSAPVCGDKCCLQDALPPLTRMVPAGSGWGRADAKEKQFFLFSSRKEGEPSPSSLPVAAAWHLLSHCPLTGLVDHPFNNQRLQKCWPSATPEPSELLVRVAGPRVCFSMSHRVWTSPENGSKQCVWLARQTCGGTVIMKHVVLGKELTCQSDWKWVSRSAQM